MNWIKRLFVSDVITKCNTCEILREQLEYERAEKRELLDVLTSQLKPQVIIQSETEFKPITPRFLTSSRRRAELERIDREQAKIRATSPVIAKPDSEVKPQETNPSIEQLEMELGVSEQKEVH